MRKTRASQASSSEKLRRLQQELESAHDLARNLCQREALKREILQCSQAVWEGRETMVNLKRKFPTIGVKEDDDLLVDKERPPKKLRQSESRFVFCALSPLQPRSPALFIEAEYHSGCRRTFQRRLLSLKSQLCVRRIVKL